MKNRILELIDGNGESIFIPQYFNEYKGWKMFQFLEYKPNNWLSYTFTIGQRAEFKTLEDAKKYLKTFESSSKIHEL
jgi:hypothetical protein